MARPSFEKRISELGNRSVILIWKSRSIAKEGGIAPNVDPEHGINMSV